MGVFIERGTPVGLKAQVDGEVGFGGFKSTGRSGVEVLGFQGSGFRF